MTPITPTQYQAACMSVPESWNLFLGGGRGGGKTTTAELIITRHVAKYGHLASVLIVRETHKAVSEIEESLAAIINAAYNKGVRHNRAEHVFRLPSGARIECGQLDGPRAYEKYQGRSFTLLVVDEFGLLRDRRWVDLLKSNLRAKKGVPLREVRTANPGGPLHAFIHQKYVVAAPAWEPFEVDGETWVYAPSIHTDNPHLDHADYARRMRAACGQDEELARAWLEGDWNIARGAYFAGVLSEDIHMLSNEVLKKYWNHPNPKQPHQMSTKGWRPFIALDWGSAAPSVCYLAVRAPGDRGPFPKDSVILLDELATVDPEDLNVGLNWPPSKLAEAITDMCRMWGAPASGVADDARGLEDSLISVLRRHGVYVHRPRKERVAGWQRMRELLTNTAERRQAPGLWVSTRCRYFWQTVPFIQRDPSRPEDVVTDGPDHAADAARYACLQAQNRVRQGRVVGWY